MHNIGWGCVEILPKIVWLCFRGVCTYVYYFIAHLLLFFSRHCRSIAGVLRVFAFLLYLSIVFISNASHR